MSTAPVRYMLDTNIASNIIRSTNNAVRARLQASQPAQMCISSVTEGELLFGLAKKPQASALREAVQSFLLHVEVLPWGRQAAAAYGTLRAALELGGTPMGNLDTMIAAHALAAGCTLVSHDRAFVRVAGLEVEDWAQA